MKTQDTFEDNTKLLQTEKLLDVIGIHASERFASRCPRQFFFQLCNALQRCLYFPYYIHAKVSLERSAAHFDSIRHARRPREMKRTVPCVLCEEAMTQSVTMRRVPCDQMKADKC